MKRRTFLQWFGISTVAVATKNVSGYHEWAGGNTQKTTLATEDSGGFRYDDSLYPTGDVVFNDAGDKMCIFHALTNTTFHYDLSSAFDISTAVFVNP